MKTKLLLCVVLLSVVVSSLCGQEREDNDLSDHFIMVREYVGFLNEVAASSNVNDLYEEASKQISCLGTLGDYHYELTTADGETPVLLLSWREAEEYCDWKNASEKPSEKRKGVDDCYYVLQASSEVLKQVDQELKSNLLTFRTISTEAKAYQASGEEVFCSSILDDLLEGVFLIAGVGNVITGQPRADELEESTGSTPDIEQQVAMEEAVAEVMQEETRAANKRARVIQEEMNAAHKRAKMAEEETRAIQAEERITMLEAEIKTLRKEKEIAEINIHIEKLSHLAFENKMKANTSLGFVKSAYQQSSDFFSEAVEYLGNAIVAISSENLENSILWREAAVQAKEAAEKHQGSAQRRLQEDENQAHHLHNVDDTFLVQLRDKKYLAEANEVEAIEKLKLAQQWCGVLEHHQQAVEYLTKSGEFYEEILGRRPTKRNINSYLLDAAQFFYGAAEKLKKGIEAKVIGKLDIMQTWCEASILQYQSGELLEKAAETYAAGRKEEVACWKKGIHSRSDFMREAIYWNYAGNGFYNSAEKLVKGMEAEEAKKPVIAQVWREAAKLQHQSVDFYKKAAETHAAGKKIEAVNWHNAGNGFSNAAEKLKKGIEAEEAKKLPIAQVWREAAKLEHQSGEFFKKAAEVFAIEEEAIMWSKGGHGFYNAAEKLKKAIEAEEGGKLIVAKAWREAAKLQHQSGEFFEKAAEAHAAGKGQQTTYWNNAGYGFCKAAEKLEKAIEAEEGGKLIVAKAWREAAKLQHQSGEFFEKAAEISATEREAHGWHNAGHGFYEAGENLGKAIKAEESKKTAIAEAWRQVAGLQQQSAEFFKKAAKPYAAGREEEAHGWHNAGNAFYQAAKKLVKGIEAEKPAIAQVWREAARLQQQSVEFYKKAAEVFAAEKEEEEAIMWNKAGSGFYRAAEKLINGIKSEEAGEPIAAQVWREAAAAQQHSVEFYKKAAEAYAAGREEEARSWENAGKGFYNTAEQLGEGIEAEESVEVSCSPGLGRCSRKVQTGPSMLKSSNKDLRG